MKTFNVPTREEVAPANQAIFDNLQKGLGFVPNLYATIGHSEHGLGRFLAYQNAKSSLSNKEKEAINLVVSQINGCVYCQSAHTVLGKMNGFNEGQIINLRKGESDNAKLDALVKLAAEITTQKGNVNDEVLSNFYAQGYTDENLVDAVIQVSEKIAMNYLHNLTQIPVDFPQAQAI